MNVITYRPGEGLRYIDYENTDEARNTSELQSIIKYQWDLDQDLHLIVNLDDVESNEPIRRDSEGTGPNDMNI
jgi:hypothetical protein